MIIGIGKSMSVTLQQQDVTASDDSVSISTTSTVNDFGMRQDYQYSLDLYTFLDLVIYGYHTINGDLTLLQL